MSIRDVAAALTRKWATALLLVGLAVAAAVALERAWPSSYEATALVTVSGQSTDPRQTTDTEVNIATEAVVLSSRHVAEVAHERAGSGGDPRDLQERTTVTVPPESNALQVSVTAPSARQAAAEANAVAEAYLAYRTTAATNLVERYRRGIDAQVDGLLEGLPPDADPITRRAVLEQVAALRSQQSLVTGTPISPGDVVSKAVPPTTPSSPGLVIFLAGGLAGGLLLGFAGALLHDRLDPRVRSAALIGRHVPCRVVDGRARDSNHVLRRVTLTLAGIRQGVSAYAMAPAVLVATPRSFEADFVRIALDETTMGTSPVIVCPEPGEAGLAHVVARYPTNTLVVLVCSAADRVATVDAMVALLEEWGRGTALLVVTGRRRRRRRPGRTGASAPSGEPPDHPAPRDAAPQFASVRQLSPNERARPEMVPGGSTRRSRT